MWTPAADPRRRPVGTGFPAGSLLGSRTATPIPQTLRPPALDFPAPPPRRQLPRATMASHGAPAFRGARGPPQGRGAVGSAPVRATAAPSIPGGLAEAGRANIQDRPVPALLTPHGAARPQES